jgi:hypothetical protein
LPIDLIIIIGAIGGPIVVVVIGLILREMDISINLSPLVVVGIILLIAGLVLSGLQLFWKQGASAFGVSVSVQKFPQSYLYVGLATAIIGVLLIVADVIRNSMTASPSTSVPSQSGTSAVESPASRESIPEQIEQLGKLRKQGLLSDEQFEEKKKELLSRM